MSSRKCPRCNAPGLIVFLGRPDADGLRSSRIKCIACGHAGLDEAEANVEYPQSIQMKSAEVDCFVHARGFEFPAACELVGINPSNYVSGAPGVSWLPLPDEIELIQRGIQSGEMVITDGHRRSIRTKDRAAELRESKAMRRLELAGRLPDDSCPIPAFLYSGGAL